MHGARHAALRPVYAACAGSSRMRRGAHSAIHGGQRPVIAAFPIGRRQRIVCTGRKLNGPWRERDSPARAFHPDAADGVPQLAVDTRSHLVCGNAGRICGGLERCAPGRPVTLDDWSARVLTGRAARLGRARCSRSTALPAVSRWAMRAEPAMRCGRWGLLIHPEYGCGTVIAGAAGCRGDGTAAARSPPQPLRRLRERPCLNACPAGAFDGRAYDFPPARATLPACRSRIAWLSAASRAMPADRADYAMLRRRRVFTCSLSCAITAREAGLIRRAGASAMRCLRAQRSANSGKVSTIRSCADWASDPAVPPGPIPRGV